MTREEALKFARKLVEELHPKSQPQPTRQEVKVQLPPKKRWSNDEYDCIKTPLESDDYDQTLAEGTKNPQPTATAYTS